MASGCDGRFKAWLGAGVGTENKLSVSIFFSRKGGVVKNKANHLESNLLGQECFQRAWTQSSVKPVEQQVESSDQFLLGKGEMAQIHTLHDSD